MDDRFQNKYRISSTRLSFFDYSDDGMYFVTVCTKDKRIFFGKIEKEQMILNSIGQIVNNYWMQIPKHFLGVHLDEYIIMPNHLHGIIEIRCQWEDFEQKRKLGLINMFSEYMVETQQCCVSTAETKNSIKSKTFYKLKPKSLPVIIRSFKSISTKTINQKFPHLNFSWQSRYYDHIIRSEKSLFEIRKYIQENPLKWALDSDNPLNFH